MKFRFLSWFPGNDYSGNYFWALDILPVVNFVWNRDPESSSFEVELTLGWLFWQIILSYRIKRKSY